MVPRTPTCLTVAILLVGCGWRDTTQPVAAPPSVPDAAQPAEPTATQPSFRDACDGNGPHADLGVTLLESDGGVQLAMVECEFFAYQGTYEVWVLPAADGVPFKTASLTGMGGLSDDGVTFTNFNKARGIGDCGTFTRFSIDAQGLHETEVRERSCSDELPADLDPATWPLRGAAASPCNGGTTHFYCPVAGGKEVALCGNASGSELQYRYGRPGTPELVLPASPDASRFRAGTQSWVRAQADWVAIENEGYRYSLIDKSGSGAMGEGEMNNFIGVRVDRGTEEVARIACAGDDNTWVLGIAPLQGQLQSIGYMP